MPNERFYGLSSALFLPQTRFWHFMAPDSLGFAQALLQPWSLSLNLLSISFTFRQAVVSPDGAVYGLTPIGLLSTVMASYLPLYAELRSEAYQAKHKCEFPVCCKLWKADHHDVLTTLSGICA